MSLVEGDGPVFKKRTTKSNLRKRPSSPSLPVPLKPGRSDSDSSSSEKDRLSSSRLLKRQKNNGLNVPQPVKATSSTEALNESKFDAEMDTVLHDPDDAASHTDWSHGISTTLGDGSIKQPYPCREKSPDGIYRGANSYRSFIQKDTNAPLRKAGPVKATTNIRAVTVTDFAPDVCKDYKQTGFCGFGDSCKFLHAREDYKQGWQLAQDWEIETKGETKGKTIQGKTVSSAAGKVRILDKPTSAGTSPDNVPFACVICKKPYRSPIVTKCGHYFCENCALHRYRKSPNCAICGASTGGVFNVAKNFRTISDDKAQA